MTNDASSPQRPGYAKARVCASMAEVRSEVDRVDRMIVRLLAERQAYVDQAGVLKADRNAVRDEARIEDVIAKVLVSAKTEGLDPEIAEPVFRLLIERAIAREFAVYDTKKSKRP